MTRIAFGADTPRRARFGLMWAVLKWCFSKKGLTVHFPNVSVIQE